MPFLLWGMVIDGYPFLSKYSFLAKLTYHGIPFKKKNWHLPGELVVRTPRIHHRELGFDP